MASVIKRPHGWEIRESVSTARGPRSRTLATFKRLDQATIEHAAARAGKALDRKDLVRAALRAGAPVAAAPADAHAGALIEEFEAGNAPRPALRRLLAAYLTEEPEPSDGVSGASAWLGTSADQRAAALVDLLLLADAIPVARRASRPSFPPFGRS
jgi:hypothetical protein